MISYLRKGLPLVSCTLQLGRKVDQPDKSREDKEIKKFDLIRFLRFEFLA